VFWAASRACTRTQYCWPSLSPVKSWLRAVIQPEVASIAVNVASGASSAWYSAAPLVLSSDQAMCRLVPGVKVCRPAFVGAPGAAVSIVSRIGGAGAARRLPTASVRNVETIATRGAGVEGDQAP
jgi:hypothetical protein